MTETGLPVSSLAHLKSIFHIKLQQNTLLKTVHLPAREKILINKF